MTVRARMRCKGLEGDACILNMSTRGLAATAAAPPARGEYVEIMLNQHRIPGLVKWSGDRRFGVAFYDRINVVAAISGKGELANSDFRQPIAGEVPRIPVGYNAPASRKVELVIFAAVAALTILMVADYVNSADAPVKVAARSSGVNG